MKNYFTISLAVTLLTVLSENPSPAFSATLEHQEARVGLAAASDTGDLGFNSRTHGAKEVLVIRVNFPDALDESISEADANEMMRRANEFFIENSYGALSLRTTVTPLLTMPQPTRWYATHNPPNELLNHARQAATAAGYNMANYDLDIVHSVSADRLGNPGFKGAWLKTSDVETACHELGHNLGLHHAGGWKTSDGSIIGPGINWTYGNEFDTMGSYRGGFNHFNAYSKYEVLGWLPETAVQPITSSGVYRLYPFDVSTLDNEAAYALKIETGTGRNYWIETRQQLITNSSTTGVLVYWSPWAQSEGGAQLLDMTPRSEGGFMDAELRQGKTFVDPTLGLTITPLRLGGTTPESIDVQITIRAVWISNALDPARHLATSSLALEAQGDEAELVFSLVYQAAFLRNPRAVLGADAAGAALEVVPDAADPGRLAIRLSLPNGETFAPGLRELLLVNFDAIPEIKDPSFIRVGIDDDPESRAIAAGDGTMLQAIYRSPELASLAAEPVLSFTRELNGDFTLILSDVVESSYDIEATSDLVTWDFVGTIPTMTGTIQMTDSSARDYDYRFYRAVQR